MSQKLRNFVHVFDQQNPTKEKLKSRIRGDLMWYLKVLEKKSWNVEHLILLTKATNDHIVEENGYALLNELEENPVIENPDDLEKLEGFIKYLDYQEPKGHKADDRFNIRARKAFEKYKENDFKVAGFNQPVGADLAL